MIKNILLVAVGGAFGSVLRYLISLIKISVTNKIYFNTLIINVLGCFLIGFLTVLFFNKINQQQLTLLFITGFCGGFTTFSTFAFENQKMMQLNQNFEGLIYIIFSVVIGIFAVYLGQKTANYLI